MTGHRRADTSASLYDEVAHEAARTVIHRYSTSFFLASRLLAASVRADVENIYALVRVADEIVDGVAHRAGLTPEQIAARLDAFEAETESALETGYSANLLVHAFACTARASGFGTEYTRPFFASMRTDLTRSEHTPESFDAYVYGSAEVVGLMCLAAFLRNHPVSDVERRVLTDGARSLGAAFQKVNFLRDLADDSQDLGRDYFPGTAADDLTEQDKSRLLDDIDRDLAVSGAVVSLLPSTSRKAVCLAQMLFAELARRIRATPVDVLRSTRVSVPPAVKMRIAAAAALGRIP